MPMLTRLSHTLFRAESLTAGLLVAAIFGVMLVSVATAAFGRPLGWSDELCVHLMVVLAFVGASMAVHARAHMTMGLLGESLAEGAARALIWVSDALVLLYLLVMIWVMWRWFDLPALWAAGSIDAYQAATFNFIYSDPTQTLGLRKIWFWLAMPITTLSAIVHVAAQLLNPPARKAPDAEVAL